MPEDAVEAPGGVLPPATMRIGRVEVGSNREPFVCIEYRRFLSPADARAMAQELLEQADKCEHGGLVTPGGLLVADAGR